MAAEKLRLADGRMKGARDLGGVSFAESGELDLVRITPISKHARRKGLHRVIAEVAKMLHQAEVAGHGEYPATSR